MNQRIGNHVIQKKTEEIYTAYVPSKLPSKEVLLSSQIEGTQSSFSDLMRFEHNQKPEISLDDVEEVSNYVKTITYGLEMIRKDFPF